MSDLKISQSELERMWHEAKLQKDESPTVRFAKAIIGIQEYRDGRRTKPAPVENMITIENPSYAEYLRAHPQPVPLADIETLTATIRSFGYTTHSQSREIANAIVANRSQP